MREQPTHETGPGIGPETDPQTRPATQPEIAPESARESARESGASSDPGIDPAPGLGAGARVGPTRRPGGIPSASPPAVRELLAGDRPSRILARIVLDDPLGVRVLVAERLRARSLLLDPDRVHLRALALCALDAAGREAGGVGRGWLAEQVDRAADEVLRGEWCALREGGAGAAIAEAATGPGAGPRVDGSSAHADLARPLGLDPFEMRAACARFNRLPEADRATFLELFVEARSLDEVARGEGRSASTVARRARRALDALLARHAEASVEAGAGEQGAGSTRALEKAECDGTAMGDETMGDESGGAGAPEGSG